jgi:hypothetical protein
MSIKNIIQGGPDITCQKKYNFLFNRPQNMTLHCYIDNAKVSL